MHAPSPLPLALPRPWVALGLPAAVVLCGPAACRSSNEDPLFDRRALVAHAGAEVILPTYRQFGEAAEALVTAAADHATLALDETLGPAALQDLQQAWRDAMEVWQRAEVMQIGPAAQPPAVGGQALRDEIYSWPTINACVIDQALVAESYADPGFFEDAAVTAYGLDALEYLAFNTSPDHRCAGSNPIERDGLWDALGEDEVRRRRAAYAAVVAQGVAEVASQLVATWENGFLGDLSTAGESGSSYGTAAGAADELFAALYYVDMVLKDLKLAMPSGLSTRCDPGPTCPNDLESRYARASRQHVLHNLEGFAALLTGDPSGAGAAPAGFIGALRKLGSDDLADRLLTDTQEAIDIVASSESTFAEVLGSGDVAPLVDIHAAVKDITDDLKSEFVTVLNLRIPAEGASDTD